MKFNKKSLVKLAILSSILGLTCVSLVWACERAPGRLLRDSMT